MQLSFLRMLLLWPLLLQQREAAAAAALRLLAIVALATCRRTAKVLRFVQTDGEKQ